MKQHGRRRRGKQAQSVELDLYRLSKRMIQSELLGALGFSSPSPYMKSLLLGKG
jgi:hypothetical protein